MRKFRFPVFPFLFAIYPLIALLGRNPGELLPQLALRFIVILSLLAGAVIAIFYSITRDPVRSLLLGTFIFWFLGSSGHVYRLLEGYIDGHDAWLHPVLIFTFILMTVFLAQKQVWQRLKPEKWSAALMNYLNITGGLMLIFAIWPIANFWLTAYDDEPEPWIEAFSKEDLGLTLTASPPDIYYIILDGYGRQDVLAEVFQHDNSQFIEFLQDRGFFVANQARSNYIQTPLSLSSSLNFDTISFSGQYAGIRSVNRIPLFELIQESRVRTMLENSGYRIVTTSSGYPFTEFDDADVYLSPYRDSLNELERFYLSTTALDYLISSNSTASGFLRRFLPLPGYEASRQRMLFSLEQLQQIPELPGPKFVFVHIVGPHPPFVLDQAGRPVQSDRPYVPGDGEAAGVSSQEYQRQYIEQLIYINGQIEVAIDAILEHSATPPIILIQGDHGPGSLLARDSLEKTCLWERTSILSAYYFPGAQTEALYPEITPVNSFRILFNTYFGTQLPLVTDRTFFSPQSWPYDFTDVTGQIEPSCSQ
jgi:hypothetical protein